MQRSRMGQRMVQRATKALLLLDLALALALAVCRRQLPRMGSGVRSWREVILLAQAEVQAQAQVL
jgi:hypothetical protein